MRKVKYKDKNGNFDEKRWQKEYYQTHKEKFREYGRKQKAILKRKRNYTKNYLQYRERDSMRGFGLEGMCLICGEFDPRYHIQHHIFGKEDKTSTTLCANCHRKYSHTNNNHKIWILGAIENGILWN